MAILGLWMMTAPDLLGLEKPAADNGHIVGPLIVSLSLIAMSESTRNARLLNLPIAVWMLAAPLVLRYEGDLSLMNEYAVAIALFFLLLVKPKRRYRFAGGWPAVWKKNISS